MDEDLKYIKRGRPLKKNQDIPIDDVKKTKRGRPRTVNIMDIKEYQKLYYEHNKEKTQGHYLCDKCGYLCSKANKSRHNKTYHCEIIKEIIQKEFFDKIL
jgi:rubrerythrin